MRTLPAIALFSALAACSSGGNTSSTAEVLIAPTVEITADNAQVALQAGVRAALDIQRIGVVGARFIKTPRPVVEEEEEGGGGVAPALLGASMSIDITGPQGGTGVFTWEDTQLDGIYSTGDVFTMTLSGYKAEKMTFNGVMVLTNVRLQGDPAEFGWKLDADLKLQGVNVSWGATDFDLTMTLPVHYEDRLVTQYFSCYLRENVFLGPWEVYAGSTYEFAPFGTRYSLAFSGVVYSTELDGVLQFETESYLEGLNLAFLSGPSFGNFYVVGAGGTRIENELDLTNFAATINPREEEDEQGNVQMVDDGVLTVAWTSLLP